MPDSLRDRQRAVREEMILDAAHDLLLTDGYQKMSMDALAARVGIAKMTLYQHFPSKDAVAVAVIVRGMQRTEATLLPVINSTQPALARLKAVLVAALDNRSTWWSADMDVIPALVIQHPTYQAQHARFTQHWINLIDAAKAEDTIDPTLSTIVLAGLLMQLFQTGYETLIQSGQVTSADLSHTLLTLLIRGMQVR